MIKIELTAQQVEELKSFYVIELEKIQKRANEIKELIVKLSSNIDALPEVDAVQLDKKIKIVAPVKYNKEITVQQKTIQPAQTWSSFILQVLQEQQKPLTRKEIAKLYENQYHIDISKSSSAQAALVQALYRLLHKTKRIVGTKTAGVNELSYGLLTGGTKPFSKTITPDITKRKVITLSKKKTGSLPKVVKKQVLSSDKAAMSKTIGAKKGTLAKGKSGTKVIADKKQALSVDKTNEPTMLAAKRTLRGKRPPRIVNKEDKKNELPIVQTSAPEALGAKKTVRSRRKQIAVVTTNNMEVAPITKASISKPIVAKKTTRSRRKQIAVVSKNNIKPAATTNVSETTSVEDIKPKRSRTKPKVAIANKPALPADHGKTADMVKTENVLIAKSEPLPTVSINNSSTANDTYDWYSFIKEVLDKQRRILTAKELTLFAMKNLELPANETKKTRAKLSSALSKLERKEKMLKSIQKDKVVGRSYGLPEWFDDSRQLIPEYK